MKVSCKWLKTMVDIPTDIAAFTNALDLTGTAVENVQTTGAQLDGIVVGHILTREAHPNADSLWVTTVDVGAHNVGEDGSPAPLQIVCGAQNFVAGDKIPVALLGTIMPNGIEIKKAKLRGVESRGMNCSARELGLGEDHAGLLILSPDAPVGVPIAQYLEQGDTVIELEITPNRPDCMSMLGIAREVGAVYNKPYTLGREAALAAVGQPASNLVRVSIDDPERCPRYTARIIKGVRVGPSPAWLVERVTAAGARSINNIVDVTNYIMFELGQPLHAFDLDTLTKDAAGTAHIVVRAAACGEEFTTLDGIKRTLDPDISVIVDGNAAAGAGSTIALAGVMGGLHSEVTETTVDILLEAATFSSAHTSRTSRKLQLFSEASARYERGVDGATCESFSARAAALMVEVAGGEVCEGVVDVYPAPVVPKELSFRVSRFQGFIGAPIPVDDITTILVSLGCEVAIQACHPEQSEEPRQTDATAIMDPAVLRPDEYLALDHTVLSVTPPTYRPDLTREVDLYEEVLRIWGMERIPATLPGGRGRIGERTREQQRVTQIGAALRASGLNQTMTYAFGAPGDNDILKMPFDERQQAVELINPMNSEQSVMRRSILPGLLRSVAYNQNHGVANVHLYELGTVFFAAEGRKQPKERQLVAGVLAGTWFDAGWNTVATALDFFDGKGVVEALLRELNISKIRFKALDAQAAPWLQPGRAAAVMAGSQQLGWIGELHPSACTAFEATAPVVAFELEVKALLAAAQPARPYKDVPQYPAIDLDVAVVVDESVSAVSIEQVITSAAGNLLDSVRLFDVYRDAEKIGAGKKSLALTLTYRAADRTLTSEEVDSLHQKVLRKLSGAVGAEIRG
ncbi:MAG: phenylalanine--tRNA ligase subunit beta [Coriobacteriales bacterium]|jgi:phenylalanyl-tRNA synthetase beta chain|nr:phenylalanine--tRNA ligase subunit beta [Coriobacteriales bacterium]